ncbi:MAG: ribosome biogenesis GTPase YlqF [Erysipelotrichaceae bacterium]
MAKDNNQNEFSKTNINWYPGHMEKAKREMSEMVKLVDMVIELRDCRIPLSSENPLINQIANNKPTLIILSKKDKAEKKETEKWLSYFASTGKQAIALDLLSDNVSTIISNACQNIMKNKIEKLKSRGMKNVQIKAMVVGIPNVGKSTLINSAMKKKIVKTADKPGVTRNLQWIKISKEVALLDTPGVLWPRLDNQQSAYLLAVTGAINDEILPIESVVEFAMQYLMDNYPAALKKRYGIEVDGDVDKLLISIAQSRNCYLLNQEVDYKRLYALLLKDIRDNQLGEITWEKYENIE